MNIYRLNMMFEDESLEDGVGWDNEYLLHSEKYSEEEFNSICEQAKEICKNEFHEVLNYTMVNVLKDRFGFSDLDVTATYNYEEWFS